MRRLHTIIYIDKNGIEHVKRKTIWTEQTDEIDLQLGLKEQIKQRTEILSSLRKAKRLEILSKKRR